MSSNAPNKVSPLPQTAQVVVRDARSIHDSVKKQKTFAFLRSDAHPLYGLQDWSIKKWKAELLNAQKNGDDAGNKFVKDFLGKRDDNGELSEASAQELATDIKDRLHHPLSHEDWKLVIMFQNERLNSNRLKSNMFYMDPSLRSNYVFAREFPLGVEQRILENEEERWIFAIDNSGLAEVRHTDNIFINLFIYVAVFGIVIFGFFFMLYLMVMRDGLWEMVDTKQDTTEPGFSEKLKIRTKWRGQVASILSSLTFSLMVNGSLDKFGKIDPSSSTVFVGMTLGGTWGFVLDNLFGSDEGFREYRWSSTDGMRYAIGALGTEYYARYIITIIFDMFFTVILFKILYCKVVRLPGFTAGGREWIANGLCSFFIAVVTFMAYANMTRFEWAYPSGEEDVRDQWISKSSMILATVIMNMVYLTVETRSTLGEKGINEPRVKLLVTIFTFAGIIGLNLFGVADPSNLEGLGNNVTANYSDFNLPLTNVCKVKSRFNRGFGILICVIFGCLGFVIFVTSKQTWTGLKEIATGKPKPDFTTPKDHLLGRIALMFIYTFITLALVCLFTFVPFYSEDGERVTEAWIEACDSYDPKKLLTMGLS